MIDPFLTARQFIIDCLSARRRPELVSALAERTAAQPPDWDVVESLALAERVAPLLYHTARREGLLPDEVLQRFHQLYTETGLRNALRFNELKHLLGALSAQKVDAIMLKGVSLAERVYGNIALRPMVDLDLLVRREDVRPALAVLHDAGYLAGETEIAPDAALEFENEILLRQRDRPDWVIELHWSLFDSPYYQAHLADDALWAAAEPMMVDGVSTHALSPEHELLHLCGHLVLHHRGAGLLWWNDIAELIACHAGRLDWDRLLSEVEVLGLVLPAQAVLPEAAERWAAPVPPGFLPRLAALAPRPDEARVFRQLTADHRPPAQRLLADLSGIPGWGARLRFLWRNLFPSGDYMDERYGISSPVKRVAYYPYRWILGARDVLRPSTKNST